MISIGNDAPPAAASEGGEAVWGAITGNVADQVDLGNAMDARITSSTRSDTATSGTASATSLVVNVAPTANSTRVVFAQKVEINFSGNFNIATGGWLTAHEKVINVSGTGTKDKIVADMAQLNLTGGNIAAAVGYEPAIATIAAGTLVGGFAGFYFPNLAGVANLANVTSIAALQNDHANAHILNRGRYLNGDMHELSAPFHIGLLAGRYYSSPVKSMAANTVVAPNVIYVTYVHVPQRTAITKLGFNVAVGAAGNAIMGLYKVSGAALTTVVAQTSSISTATTGEKEGTIAATVDAGTYAIVAVFSGTPTISWHEILTHGAIGASSGTGYSEAAFIPFAFGALPAIANIVPTFTPNTIEPHLWFRL